MAFASKFASPLVSYSVKNTFVDVTPAKTRPVRSSSAPPAAHFTQVSVESPRGNGSFLEHVATETSEGTHVTERDQVDRMSRKTILEMQLLTKNLNLKTSRWIRVVHSGYGASKWEEALQSSAVAWVAASKTAEGFYVHVPTKLGKDGICQALKQLNSAVRRDTYFPDMKRSNKSRLQFKEEIVVASSGTLVQEDASTSAGSESGSPVEAGSSEFDAVEQFLSALNSDFQAGPTVADAPATPHEMPGDSVLDYYQQPPQVRHMQRGDAHSSKHSHYRNHKEWSANAQFGYWRQETLTVPVYMCVGALR